MSEISRYDTRETKSEKILSVLRDVFGEDLSKLTCLDVGCASGAISGYAASYFHHMIGIDLDSASIFTAARSHQAHQMHFVLASGHHAPFPDNAFDVLICAQVYEHSTDQQALAAEIWRVLRPGGACFFSGPNRLKVMEEHYWLPFLSWLPRPLADWYMRSFHRGDYYDAYPLFFWQIRNLWQHFQVIDYTFQILKEPEKYSMQQRLGRFQWIKKAPDWLLKLFQPFLPNYNWILIKK
jgi:SAM-dependent methyltransferase